MSKPRFNRKSAQKYKQGIYECRNQDKYLGNPRDIIYRSSLEKRFCAFCDISPDIIKWGSETVVIPYIGPDGKPHRYFTDYHLHWKDDRTINGVSYWVIEVKPANEVYDSNGKFMNKHNPPKKPKIATSKALKSYHYKLETWAKNMRKWEAAKKYCQSKGWHFRIITEDDIKNLLKTV